MLLHRLTSRPAEAAGLLIAISLALWFFFPHVSPSSIAPNSPPPYSDTTPWTFDGSKHAALHTLTTEQCSSSFPNLYHSTEQAAKRRAGRPIALEELEISQGRCMLRALIYDQELFIIDIGGPESCYVPNFRERSLAILSLIHRSLASSPSPIPDIEFAISLDDWPLRSKDTGSKWALTRQASAAYDDVWLMPDYGYWSWHFTNIPSYHLMRQTLRANDEELPFQQKIEKAVWRGKTNANPVRGALVEATRGKLWSDVVDVDVVAATKGEGEENQLSKVLTFEEMCQYKFLLQTEGTSYSGRLKYLQACKSVIISHTLQWEEFHTHLLVASGPEQNYVEIADGWANLDEEMQRLMWDPQEAEAIATRGAEFFGGRYLTPAAITCYWRHLFHSWASVQGFQPKLYDFQDGKKVLRGVPYSEFIVNWPQDPSKIP